jgi:hypothetical protein
MPTRLRTPGAVIEYFRNHPDIAVCEVDGIYEIWTRRSDGHRHQRMARYTWHQLKYWARQFG